MAEKLRVRLKSATVQPLEATMPVPAIVQGGSSIYVSDIPEKNGRDAFSTGGAYLLQSQIDKKANKEEIPTIPNIPTKTSELENDSNFIDEEILNGKGYLTNKDIEGLATEQYINDLVGGINSVLDEINGEVV